MTLTMKPNTRTTKGGGPARGPGDLNGAISGGRAGGTVSGEIFAWEVQWGLVSKRGMG